MAREIEIKFAVEDLGALARKLRRLGFQRITRRTHESNTLYDTADGQLRARGELLRIRKFGDRWILTHKAKDKNQSGRHKSRVETETEVTDGANLDIVLRALGFTPSFAYEKYRAEWSDGTGHVVVDETPIGNFGEIEGPARWIDRTAKGLQIDQAKYITANYAQLFQNWRIQTESTAKDMTFRSVQLGKRPPKRR